MLFSVFTMLAAHAGERAQLTPSACGKYAQPFADAAYAHGIQSWRPEWESSEHVRVAKLSIAADFTSACPLVRGLDVACLKDVSKILDATGQPGGRAAAEAALPRELVHCIDQGGALATLFNAMEHPKSMCGRTGAPPLWAGACAPLDPVQDVRWQLGYLKNAMHKYDAEYDGFIVAGNEAAARAAIKGATPYTWVTDDAWNRLGWMPEPPVHVGFWVEVTRSPEGDEDFAAHGIVDSDKDGCAYHMVVTARTNPTVVPGTENCR